MPDTSTTREAQEQAGVATLNVRVISPAVALNNFCGFCVKCSSWRLMSPSVSIPLTWPLLPTIIIQPKFAEIILGRIFSNGVSRVSKIPSAGCITSLTRVKSLRPKVPEG